MLIYIRTCISQDALCRRTCFYFFYDIRILLSSYDSFNMSIMVLSSKSLHWHTID